MTGTWQLVRLALRRDRWLLPLWVIGLGLFVIGIGSSFKGLYTDQASLESFAASMSNPSLSAFYGPIFAVNLGGITAWRSSLVLIISALAVGLTVIRHTRAEEEQGRRELLGSTVVGRQAGLAAATLVALAASTVLGALIALGLTAMGFGASGSLALGLEYAVAGWLFTAVAAVAAQLTQGARAARWITILVLGVCFLLRVVGDAGGEQNSPLSWISPIGLLQRLRPYGDERWWVLPIVAALAVVIAAAAYALSARRDLDAGIFATRPGPARAGRGLRSPLGLAWRLQRGNVLGWSIGFIVLGLVLGGAADSAQSAVEENAQLADALRRIGGDLTISDLFIGALFAIMGIIAAAQGVQLVLRARAEESAGRAEPVLAAAVGRNRWLGGHTLMAYAGPLVSMVAAGLFTGLAYGAATGDVGGQVPRILGAALVQIPASWFTVSIAVALVGLLPRLSGLAWGFVVVFLLLGQLGAVLQLSQWALDVSPFTHLPKLPGGDVTVTPLVWLLALAVALTAAGMAGFRRRDVG